MSLRDRVELAMAALHDDITSLFVTLDGGGAFREDAWERPGGGGGVARVLVDGTTFEKAGINRSVVTGEMDAAMARRFGAQADGGAGTRFYATGVSLVIHPRSPMVPTVHLNVRYFEIAAADGTVVDRWFGGGTDLTPMYPFPDDAVHFHRAVRAICDRHHPGFYARFKPWCDRYFTNTHRHGEARGIGGIFFDGLRPGAEDAGGLDEEGLLAFVLDVGRALPGAYGPIVDRRRHEPWGERERHLQLVRRGRYVEFNLVHDRGTVFGLQTGARIESVLMSLPPLAAWDYDPVYEPGSIEAELLAMLQPRDWAAA